MREKKKNINLTVFILEAVLFISDKDNYECYPINVNLVILISRNASFFVIDILWINKIFFLYPPLTEDWVLWFYYWDLR